ERLAAAALRETNRHHAAALVRTAMEQTSEELPGLRNKGLLATHELLVGVPARPDWQQATEAGAGMLKHRDHDLIEALGFDIKAAGNHDLLRPRSGNARVTAVFLEEIVHPAVPSFRLDVNPPVSY